jgi:site-specific DNA-methyltransferase (adenine-specific)|tara:strand:+ start:104 stop:1237 length:1134 start_codon:yes stop_codon:yes gene_type:complete
MQIHSMPTADLINDPNNARTHDDRNIDAIVASLDRFGQQKPIVVDANNVVVAGNGTLAAAVSLGWKSINVVKTELNDTDAILYAIADNRTAELAAWNAPQLHLNLVDLDLQPADFDAIGFTEKELGDMFPDTAIDDSTKDDVPEVEAEVFSQHGETYELGQHILVCGDALDADLIAKMSEGADAVVADPPYGTGIDAPKGLGNSSVPMSLVGDHDPSLARKAVEAWVEAAPVQVWWGANYYLEALTGSPCWLVWDKDHHGMTFADAELAWVNSSSPVRCFRHAWSGMHRASERNTIREHPTQKPVALYEWTFDGRVPENGVVVDPFGGSGSTLIACAATGRVARLIELDPRYCDVIRRRWTKYAKANGLEVGSGELQ